MRVKKLSLKNIGPFLEAHMEFMTDTDEKPPAILITGENGTGKSIILDAIRGMFGQDYVELERDIRRKKRNSEPYIEMLIEIEGEDKLLKSMRIEETSVYTGEKLSRMPQQVLQKGNCPNWIVDYWSSTLTGLADDSYKLGSFKTPEHNLVFLHSLQGKKSKANITQLICYFDYMRDSQDPQEQATGEYLYQIIEKIIAYSLLEGGKLSHIARSTFEPIVIQNGQLVSLTDLSSGNSYLIQNMVSLLGKMYSIHVLRQTPLEELGKTPGLLLIDEAENQLHPKWQKRLIRTILEIFPNLQIIATTHSPFIISSAENPRLFVCKSMGDHCVVVDETAEYSNKPIDEILMSPLFEETLPFNEKISQLITQRKQAIQQGDKRTRDRLEAQLKALNPDYFSYLDVDKMIEEMAKAEAHA